jgi:MFS transporter, FHS family, L-fucose permease
MSKKLITAIIFLIGIWVQFTGITGMVLGPTFMRLLHLSKTQTGFILGSISGGFLLSASMAGHFIFQRGTVKALLSGLCLIILSVFLILFSANFQMLLVCLVMIGISNALLINANTTILSELFHSDIRRIISLYSAFYFGISALMTPLLGKWLNVAKDNNWDFWIFRVPYIVNLMAFALFLFLSVRFIFPFIYRYKNNSAIKDEHINIRSEGDKELSDNLRYFWWIPVMGFLHNLMVAPMLAWSNPMAQARFGASELQGALFIGVITIGIATGRFLMGLLKIVWEDRTVLTFGTILGSLFVFMGLVSRRYGISITMIGIGSFISSVSYPSIASISGRFFGSKKAKIYGYFFTGVALAGFIGPPLVGKLSDYGLPIWNALAVSPLAGCLLGFLSFLWKKSQK